MATTSFTIYSRYDSEKDKERLQRETGQLPDDTAEVDNEQLWREAVSARFLRAQRPPPKFVPAATSYESVTTEAAPKQKASTSVKPLGASLSSWYRSLTTTDDGVTAPPPSFTPNTRKPTPQSTESPKKFANSAPVRHNKNDWFIRKVLPSETSRTSCTPPSTLADMLARSPPPLPSEPRYKPPAWIEIGPSNKGFMMLSKSGWSEGEALGPNALRQRLSQPSSITDVNDMPSIRKGKQKADTAELEENRGPWVVEDDVSEAAKAVDVIDLTLSDSESEESVFGGTTSDLESHQRAVATSPHSSEVKSTHGRVALLTPIATVLKLDRLGIGLKAKTVGPYKASLKRVTHKGAALTAHIKAAEEARRVRKKFGRGWRGYERQRRKEEEKRRDLLAYMNT